MKLMIIGIDSMNPNLLFNNIDMFPNIKKIYQEGCYSSYDAYAYGYGSRDNWVSLYTGLSPKQHGVINNRHIVTKEIPTYSDYSDKKPFWKVLSNNNIKIGMWRGLITSPPEEINGYMVSGEVNYEFDGSKVKYESMAPICNPKDSHIQELIKGDIGYPSPPKKPSDYGYSWDELFRDNSMMDKILKEDNYYEEAYLYLEKELEFYKKNIINVQKKYPVDVLFYYTPTIDLIQHFQCYDPNRRLILDSMKLMDKFIGNIISELNPENIIVISDHGMTSFKDALTCNDINIQKEAFGWRDNSIWLKNGEIIAKARNDGFLSGFHDIKGTFIASGKDIKKCNIKDMRTLDFYPTLLELLDIEIPSDRNGYVLDIFKKATIINEGRLLRNRDIKYKKIAIIQNIEVSEFNKVINEVFLDYRFCELTLFCEQKYKSIFESNTRLKKVLDIDDYVLNKELLKDFDYAFFGYKNSVTKEIKYIKLELSA